jgi:uncharacterized protein YkwD
MAPETRKPKTLSRRITRGLLMSGALFCAPVLAQEHGSLIELINAYRESSEPCAGAKRLPAGALSPDPALAEVKLSGGSDLQQALKDAGFRAARAEAITVSGPSSPVDMMAAIKRRYCSSLARPEYTAIGVSRSGNAWRIILARPLLSPDLGDAFETGKNVLKLVNAARAQARTCGNKRFGAAKPLAWNEELAQAALAHSTDMATQNYFKHEGKDGVRVGTRAQRTGYRWRRIGENIAAGQGSAQATVAGWLSSPGHCSNIMNPDFSDMGAAYAVNNKSDMVIYWTQVFGTRR